MRGVKSVFLAAALLQPADGFTSGPAGLVARHSPAAINTICPVRIPPLQIPAPADVSTRLRSAAVAWVGSLANSALPADDLMLALVSPEAFWLLREWRRQAFGQQEALREALDGARRRMRGMGSSVDSPLRGSAISVRSKGLWSTFHKAAVCQKCVHDVLAVRVVLKGDDDEADVYGALASMRAEWPAVPGRFKDYVAFPKANGYQGLHDTLTLPNGRPFEVQIRTASMHREAETGAASHRKYKGAVAQLSEKMITGATMRWPLQPQEALALATRLADDH